MRHTSSYQTAGQNTYFPTYGSHEPRAHRKWNDAPGTAGSRCEENTQTSFRSLGEAWLGPSSTGSGSTGSGRARPHRLGPRDMAGPGTLRVVSGALSFYL